MSVGSPLNRCLLAPEFVPRSPSPSPYSWAGSMTVCRVMIDNDELSNLYQNVCRKILTDPSEALTLYQVYCHRRGIMIEELQDEQIMEKQAIDLATMRLVERPIRQNKRLKKPVITIDEMSIDFRANYNRALNNYQTSPTAENLILYVKLLHYNYSELMASPKFLRQIREFAAKITTIPRIKRAMVTNLILRACLTDFQVLHQIPQE